MKAAVQAHLQEAGPESGTLEGPTFGATQREALLQPDGSPFGQTSTLASQAGSKGDR